MSNPAVTVDGTDIAVASLDGVGVINGDSYSYANEALADIHDYGNPEKIVGKEWSSLYSTENRGLTADELLKRVRWEGVWRGSAIGRRQNDSPILVELSMRATEAGIVCVVRGRFVTVDFHVSKSLLQSASQPTRGRLDLGQRN